MNKGVIYYTRIREEYQNTHLEHMIGDKLLETALKQERNIKLSEEPRGVGEHGKPFCLTDQAYIIISAIQVLMWYAFWQTRRWESIYRSIER